VLEGRKRNCRSQVHRKEIPVSNTFVKKVERLLVVALTGLCRTDWLERRLDGRVYIVKSFF
jgi:hypothetical protein